MENRELTQRRPLRIFITMLECCEKQPIILHILIVLLVVLYALFGGWVFLVFEANIHLLSRAEQIHHVTKCTLNLFNNTDLSNRNRADLAVKECFEPFMELDEWTFHNSILYAFTVMTTVGYGKFAPMTDGGRLFSILFALLGIPLTMIILGNIGKYLKTLACMVMEWFKKRCKKYDNDEENEPKEPTHITGWILLSFFLGYLFMGTVILLVSSNMPFVTALYFTFTSLTGGDFRQMASGRLMYLPLKLAYASIGIAIATVAIDVGSDYLKKVHSFGRKLKNAGDVMVWFGGKRLSVQDLVLSIARKCGMDKKKIFEIDIDELVESTIEQKENGTLYQMSDDEEESIKLEIEPEEYLNKPNFQPKSPKPPIQKLRDLEDEFDSQSRKTSFCENISETSFTLDGIQNSNHIQKAEKKPLMNIKTATETPATPVNEICAFSSFETPSPVPLLISIEPVSQLFIAENNIEPTVLQNNVDISQGPSAESDSDEIPEEPEPSENISLLETKVEPEHAKARRVTPPRHLNLNLASRPAKKTPSPSSISPNVSKPVSKFSPLNPDTTRRASKDELGRTLLRQDPKKRYELYKEEWERLNMKKTK